MVVEGCSAGFLNGWRRRADAWTFPPSLGQGSTIPLPPLRPPAHLGRLLQLVGPVLRALPKHLQHGRQVALVQRGQDGPAAGRHTNKRARGDGGEAWRGTGAVGAAAAAAAQMRRRRSSSGTTAPAASHRRRPAGAPGTALPAYKGPHLRRTFQTSPSAGMRPCPITKSRISDSRPLL